METKTISLEDLRFLLTERKGAQFVTFTVRTDARLKKTDNPFAMPVQKISRINGVINFQYENAVNLQRGREFDPADGEEFELFKSFPRKWGVRVARTPFVTHNEITYIEVKVQRSLGHAYIDANGKPLTDEEVKPFLPKVSSNADHQGVEREIILRDYKLAGILEMTVAGETFVVEQAETVASKE